MPPFLLLPFLYQSSALLPPLLPDLFYLADALGDCSLKYHVARLAVSHGLMLIEPFLPQISVLDARDSPLISP